MVLDYRTLRYILTAAEEGNISKAAQKLRISQPSLSHCILRQERALGVTLFDRTRQPLRLTYAGEKYAAAARQILTIRDNLEREMRSIAEKRTGRLSLAITKPRSAFLLPLVIPHFKKLYPNVEIELFEDNAANLESFLILEKAEIGVLFTPLESESLESGGIYREDILLCLPDRHRLVEDFVKNGVDMKKLEGEPFLRYKPWQRMRKMEDAFFAEHNFKPTTAIESELPETILGLCAVGMGCALVPRSVLKYSGVYPEPYGFTIGAPPISLEFVFAWKKNATLGWAAMSFMTVVREILEQEFLEDQENMAHPSSETRIFPGAPAI
jgi:DNA-binding transcriptional LysR family regulator